MHRNALLLRKLQVPVVLAVSANGPHLGQALAGLPGDLPLAYIHSLSTRLSGAMKHIPQ